MYPIRCVPQADQVLRGSLAAGIIFEDDRIQQVVRHAADDCHGRVFCSNK